MDLFIKIVGMEKIILKLIRHYGTYREMAKQLGITETTIHNARKGKGSHILNDWLTMKARELKLIK